MNNQVLRLHNLLAAIAPIVGVSVGTIGVSASVRIDFDPAATAQQRTDAQTAVDGHDWSQAAQDIFDAQQLTSIVGRQTVVYKTADQSSTSTSYADCTGLSFNLAPNTKYLFEFTGAYTAAINTTGLALSANGPASPVEMSYVVQAATGPITVAQGAQADYDTGAPAPTSGGATALPFWLKGTIKTGVNGGLFFLRFASEVGGSAVTIKKGSIGELAAAA